MRARSRTCRVREDVVKKVLDRHGVKVAEGASGKTAPPVCLTAEGRNGGGRKAGPGKKAILFVNKAARPVSLEDVPENENHLFLSLVHLPRHFRVFTPLGLELHKDSEHGFFEKAKVGSITHTLHFHNGSGRMLF